MSPEQLRRVLRLPSLREGSVFAGRYRVSGWLGSGGAGEVFAATDEVTGEEVALKVLYPRADLEAALARLRREVRVLRPLRHPGIVRLHDVGQSEGLLYLVMERLRGRTLGQRLAEEGALPAWEVEALARGLLGALSAAHEAGVIHRDIKPGNIFLCREASPESADESGAGRQSAAAPEEQQSPATRHEKAAPKEGESLAAPGVRAASGTLDESRTGRQGETAPGEERSPVGRREQGSPGAKQARGGAADPVGAAASGSPGFRVVLLDFGLARGLEDARLTMTGQFAGTPEYVSPEQAEGRTELTAATDLFSAGLVLCRALSDGPLSGEDSASSQLAARRRGVPRRAREALGRATPRLRQLIEWLLEHEPRERPRDAGQALALLEGRRRRAPAWLRALRRRRATVALVAALLLAAAAAFVPVRIELDDGQPRRRSLLGVDLGGWDLPRQAQLPFLGREFPGLGRWLVTLRPGYMPHGRPCMPEGYPSGLGVIRPWSRRIEPFLLNFRAGPAYHAVLPHHQFEGYDQVFVPPLSVERVPWPGEHGRRLFVTAYTHSRLAPGQLAVFLADGTVVACFNNPGHFRIDKEGLASNGILLPPKPDGAGAGLFLFTATNLALGDRGAVGAIELSALGRTPLYAPPLDRPGQGSTRLRYYFALDYQAAWKVQPLSVAGGEARLVDSEGELLLRFDPRRGVPLDPADRNGLGAGDWQAREDELRQLLHRTVPGASMVLPPAQGASLLEAFAQREAATAFQRGLALGRAAELSLESGDPQRAGRLARRALTIEPTHLPHARLLLQAETRLHGWRVARQAVQAAFHGASWASIEDRDLAVAVAATGSEEEVRELLATFRASPTERREYYPAYCASLLSLHLGQGPAVTEVLDGAVTELRDLPEFSFLEALALVLEGPPRAADARALIDAHDTGFGSGNPVPIVPLRALLAEWGAGEPPSAARLEEALRRQHEKGRSNFLSWLFVPWAEALAARVALERGDEESFARHAAAARSAPGAGPWLERMLPREAAADSAGSQARSFAEPPPRIASERRRR